MEWVGWGRIVPMIRTQGKGRVGSRVELGWEG